MIETYLLEALVAFKECGTLSAASEKLHITQPALSRSMQKLEDVLEVSLFERTKNSIALNSTGELAASLARSILLSQEEMITKIRNYDSSLKTISIGSCAPGPLIELAMILPNLFPAFTFSSSTKKEDELFKDLISRKHNLIITTRNINDSSISSVRYGTEHLFIGAVPAHPLSHYQETGVSFADINGEYFLMISDIGIWQDIKEKMMPDSHYITQDDHKTLSTLVNASSLLSFATDLSLRLLPERSNTDRVYIPVNDPEATITFYCNFLSADKDKLSPFLEYLADHKKEI